MTESFASNLLREDKKIARRDRQSRAGTRLLYSRDPFCNGVSRLGVFRHLHDGEAFPFGNGPINLAPVESLPGRRVTNHSMVGTFGAACFYPGPSALQPFGGGLTHFLYGTRRAETLMSYFVLASGPD